jgi:hypothetical protein
MPPERMVPTGTSSQKKCCKRENRTKTIDHLSLYRVENIHHGMGPGPQHEQDIIEPERHSVACSEQRQNADPGEQEK